MLGDPGGYQEKVEKTMGSRTIVVGDIHGCYDELEDMLAEVNFGPSDRLISVGDLITKGPKSREVLDRFIAEPCEHGYIDYPSLEETAAATI